MNSMSWHSSLIALQLEFKNPCKTLLTRVFVNEEAAKGTTFGFGFIILSIHEENERWLIDALLVYELTPGGF